MGWSVTTKASISLMCTKPLPKVRGICRLISAMTIAAESTAWRATSMLTPKEQ
ncbi:hypothetical protein D3C87_1881120 [compost metagenome]